MMDKTISVVYPAYNEEENIEHVITAAWDFLRANFKDFEIIVVDDGSSDRTKAISKDLALKLGNIRIIEHVTNSGYGASVSEGLKRGECDLVFFSDADGQFDIGELSKLAGFIDEYDMVIGYRESRDDPIVRKATSFFYNMIVRMVFGIKFRDMNCAFKLFRKSSLSGIELHSRNYLINAELLTKAKLAGRKIKEVAVSHYPRRAGRSKVVSQDIARTLKEILDLKRELKI